MNSIYVYLLFFILLFLSMAIYFKFANRYNIIDRPNNRSSHFLITVRGGGIIFPLSALLYAFLFRFYPLWFLGGLFLISTVSFIDDIKEVNGKIRMGFQFLATSMVFIGADLFKLPFYLSAPLLVFCVATLNAWNFMDGINGITGGYSLLVLVTLIYINDRVINFGSTGFMIAVSLSLIVFIFYNFRTEARCFAGDVGSISIAFIIIFLMTQLLIKTQNINYILFILIYGLDTGTTVLFRKLRKENIMEPHRSHLYQRLANEKKLPHNTVSLIYIIAQIVINIIVVFSNPLSGITFFLSLFISTLLFIGIRFAVEGKNRLLNKAKVAQ